MGERGPARKPTIQLVQSGSWRAKVRKNEPKPAEGKPECPKWLRKMAKTAWKRVVPQLEAMGLLHRCDQHALERYCQTYAKWREAEAVLAKHGNTYEGVRQNGNPYVAERPEVKLSLALDDRLSKLEKQFGLTPSARAGLATTKSDPDENRGRARFFENGKKSA